MSNFSYFNWKLIMLLSYCLLLIACEEGNINVKDTSSLAPPISPELPENPPTDPEDDYVLDPEKTYYIRSDGGSQNECNGRSDQAYPGSGTNQNCAWKHPFYAFSVKDSSLNAIAGGSTIIIKSGSYEIGLGAISDAESGCHGAWSYDCFMKAIPSGTVDNPTRILGEGYASGCSSKPELWGSGATRFILNLTDSDHIIIDCLEITDRSNCIVSHRHGEGGSQYTCDNNDAYASSGIKASDSEHVKLKNLDVHGLALKGIFAGRIKDWSLEKVKINANGWVGWDGDLGGDSSNSGTISFKDVEIAWNGCTENYPNTNIVACWGQESGGYGDGLGTDLTSGTWVFENLYVHHNTSDGIDLLYTNEDVDITFRRVHAEGNAGNQLKTNGKTLIENSLIIGNCGYFSRNATGLSNGENCRALGSVLSIGLVNDKPTVLKNNTILSEGDAAILSACDASCDYSKVSLEMYNNIIVGYADFHQSTFDISALHWHENTSNTNDGMSVGITNTSKNIIYNVKNDFCLGGDNLCATNPELESISNIDNINATPVSSSIAIDNANINFATSLDVYGNARANPDIGAIEY